MSTQVQFSTFNFKDLPVRTIIDTNSEIWFCGKDVCDILGYQNSRLTIQKHCKTGGVSKRYTPTQSAEQEITYINEPNLYRLIIKSRKPEAEPFEAWVFEEVLPTIRKTGAYSVKPQQLALPEPITYHMTIDEVISLAWLWRVAENCRELLEILYPALEKIGSSYAGTARGYATEHVRTIEVARQVIAKITADLTDRDHYAAYVLNGLRRHKVYQPKP